MNGVDVDSLGLTIEAIQDQPELGAAQFHGTSRWLDGHRVTTTIDRFDAGGGNHQRPLPHLLATDLPEALLGTDQGPSPLEAVLAALSSCVTTTLVTHASAKGIKLNSLDVIATGDIDLQGFLNIADIPAGYQHLNLAIVLRADLPAEEIQSFVAFALRLSPVLDLLRRGAEVSVTQTSLDSTSQSSTGSPSNS